MISSRADICERVRRFLDENFFLGDGTVLPEGASLMQSHVLDSTGFLELVSFLEATFDIQIEGLEMVPDNLDSLSAIAAFVTRKQAEAADAPQSVNNFSTPR